MCKTKKNNGLCAYFKFPYRSILSWLLVFFVNPVMALDFTLTANPDPAQNNEQVNVQMIVTNDGNTAETNLTAQMIYPVGLNNISESAVIGPLVTATSCDESGSTTLCQPGETLNWNIGTLQPGESSILRILPTTLNASVTGDVVSFSATVSDEANQLASSSADVDIDTEPELTLALFENKNPVAFSDTLTYTLRYGNRSNANVTTTTLNFSIPAGTSFVSATGNGIESNGEVSWDLGTFVVGSVAQQQVVVMVDNALSDGTQLESSALINGTSNFNPTERRSTSNTVIASSEPLDISLQLNPVMALGNQQVDLQIVVTNVSNANVTGTAVRMVHPNGANNVREASIIGPFDPSISCNAAGSTSLCQSGEALNWNLGTLIPGQEVIMNLPVSALNNSVNGRVLPFAAVVTDDTQNTAIARNTLIVDTAPELTLSIFEDKNPVAAGDTLTYTLRYGNRSNANVTSSILSFPIPVGTTFVSASNNGALTNSEVNWDLGTFPVGAVTQQQVVVQVDNPLVNGTQIRSAAVISGTSNANPTEQRATSNSVVASSAPLDISLQLNPVSALGNEQVDAQIVVTNTSNGNVTGAAVRMVFPQGANNVREASIMGPFDTATSCNAEGSTTLCQPGEALNWNLGTLIPGQTVLMGMPVSALNNSVNGRMVPFIAVVSDDSGDTAIARNTLIVDTDPELTLSMFEDKNPVAAGDTLTYTLSYGNRSDANVTSSALSFPVPVGTTFVSVTGNGALVNGEVVWDLGTFLVGAVAQQQVSVLVNNALVNGTQIESSALIQGTSNFNPTERRVTSNSVVASSAPFDISVQLNPASAMGNEHVDLQVVVTNISNANISGTAVRMVYPQGANNVSELSITGPFDTATSCNAAGSTSLCQEGEALNWNLATLVPGQTVVMNLPFSALNNSVNGRIVPFAAVVTDDTGDTAVSRNALIVDTDPELTLSMFEDKHPVAAGDLLTYTLRYGNRSDANVTSTTLRLPIPVGTTFVAASPGSVVANGMVSWNLGDLSPEAIGEARLRVTVDNSLGAGTQLAAKAVIDGSVNSGAIERTASSLTVINDNAPLGFSLQVNTVPSLPGEQVEVQMSVTNNTVADITGITLQMLYPGGVNNTAEADVTGLFDAATSCNASGTTSLCQLHEVLNWNIGTLAAASSASASLPPEVAVNWGEGNLINWVAVTRADGGATSWQMVTLPVGAGDDLDGDGFGGDFDNCPNVANADQLNFDLDALGDVCDDDDDNDGLLDAFELQYGLNPFDASDATLDGDMDNLNNLDEQAAGTSPIDPDSDDDGLLDGEDKDPLNDNPPVANAGLDGMVREGNTVNLDGSDSSDSDGGSLTFAWLQTSGTPTVVLDDASSEMPSFTAPDVSGSEDFIFELTVTDSNNTAVTDSVTITVAEDAAPNADAGADQPSGSNTILPGETVTLNGSNSSDVFDAVNELSFVWAETSATGVVLSDINATMPTFVAPSFGGVGGVVTFELTVTDTVAQSDVDSVIINVSALSAPTADAGPAQDVVEGQTVTLNGANSSDTDGTIAGYLWSQTGGAMVTLSDSSVAQPTFTAPAAPETLTFELEVTDNDGLMASDTVMVNITTNPVPACMAGPDQMVAEFDNGSLSEVVLDAGSSTIVSGTIDGYLWTQLSGSNITLSTPNQVQSGFTVPEVAPGGEAFTFRVTCTSDLGVMASDELTINVSDVNRVPTADAGTDQNVNEQETVTLDGTASSDPDGTTITSYSWSLTSASLGSSVTLDDSTSEMPSFTAPDVDVLSGEALTFELTVSDGDLQSTDTVIVNVVRVNEPPVADAGTAQNVDEGLAVTLTAAASTDPEGGVLDFVWTQKSGTQVTLVDALTAGASFDAPSVGVAGEDLVFEVTVTDDGGLMSMAEVTISIVNVPIDPLANAGGDQTVTEGDMVTLDGSGSSDADDNIVGYSWVQDSGDAVTLTGASTAMASFEAPTVDSGTLTLVFTLTVTDELGNTASEQVTITVKNTSSGGGGGGGCTLGEPGRIDPTLPLLALFSLIWINRRKRLGAERMGS